MLESIVRPFQRPDTFRTRRIVAHAEKVEVGTATISWGAAGTIAGAEEVEDLGVAFTVITCDDEYDERPEDRKEVEDRITQVLADGTEVTENFVDVKRPTYLAFDKKSEFEKMNYEKTTSWQTAVETATFTTVDINNKKCMSRYNLKPPTT